VELFKKKDSRFYWYDFKVRGKRYRRSTKETNKRRAEKIAALKLSQAMEGTGLLDRKAPSLQEFSTRFLSWIESATLAGQTKTYYCNGWRLLSTTDVLSMRLDHITKDDVEGLSFSGSASNANCALRTLRRMLHKAEEWNLIGRVSKFKLLTEHGRSLRLDEDAEQKLLVAAKACNWKPSRFELLRDSGTLDQIKEDIAGCRNIGAHEIHFDPTFMEGGQVLDRWLAVMEQMRKLVS